MEYPTFGGQDGKLNLCVQSLDRKGELPRAQDRHKVLLNRVPKRHRSITALNFFASPPPSSDCPPPVPAIPAAALANIKRPVPKFLEVFTPLSAEEKAGLVALSNVSTPSTSASSIPATPSSPRQELHPPTRVSRSYFLLAPGHHYERNPTLMVNDEWDDSSSATTTIHARPLGCSDILPDDSEGVAEEWHKDHEEQLNTSDRSRRPLWQTTRPEHEQSHELHGNALMMDGTFGRM